MLVALELLGLVLVVCGVWLVSVPAAFCVAGVSLIGLAVAVDTVTERGRAGRERK